MATDGGLRPLFHDRLRSGIMWQAIETGGTGRGIPDSYFCGQGVGCGWVEMKQTAAWNVGLSPEQVSWAKTNILRGGRVFLAVRRRHEGGPRKGDPVDELWLCSGWWNSHVAREGLRCPDVTWLGVWGGGPARWDWSAVRDILRSGEMRDD